MDLSISIIVAKKLANNLLCTLTNFHFWFRENLKNQSLKYDIFIEVLKTSKITFDENEFKKAFNQLFNAIAYRFKSKYPSIKELEKLIEYDRCHNNYIDMNEIQFHKRTCLTSINQGSNVEFLSLLLKFGSDPNLSDGLGILPLQYAFYDNNDEFIKYDVASGKIDFDKKVPDVLNKDHFMLSDLIELYNSKSNVSQI